MSHIEWGVGVTIAYFKTIFWNNIATKFFSWIISWYCASVYAWNEALFQIFITLFLIDWFLWTIKVMKHKIFTSRWFFKWIYKLLSYGILLYLWSSLDMVLPSMPMNMTFIGLMFWFIAITEISSILENLEDLWFEVPSFLRRVLSIHREKFFTDQVKKITWYDIWNKYLDDLNKIEVFIDGIKNDEVKKLFKIKIVYFRRIVMELCEYEISDLPTFKIKLDLLFKHVWAQLEVAINNSKAGDKCKKEFMKSHDERFKQLLWELTEILDIDKKIELKEERLKIIKSNVIQSIIRIIYKNVADKYDIPEECCKPKKK